MQTPSNPIFDRIRARINDYITGMDGKSRYEINDATGDEATIYLYDIIGEDWFGGVSASAFAQDLAGITAGTIHLRINSPGGDVFEARAMQTALAQHPSKVIAHIDGLAASAATYVMLGADEIEAVDGALFMIHDAWTIAMGNKADFRKTADTLEKIDEGIAADYVAKTGNDIEQVRAWMAAETEFTAQEALDNGFIDRIYEKEDDTKTAASKREAEKALRDVGFSKSDAKTILANGFNELDCRDDNSGADDETQQIADMIRRATAILKD
jgi:ATP-dependent Clp protease, protease subunit